MGAGPALDPVGTLDVGAAVERDSPWVALVDPGDGPAASGDPHPAADRTMADEATTSPARCHRRNRGRNERKEEVRSVRTPPGRPRPVPSLTSSSIVFKPRAGPGIGVVDGSWGHPKNSNTRPYRRFARSAPAAPIIGPWTRSLRTTILIFQRTTGPAHRATGVDCSSNLADPIGSAPRRMPLRSSWPPSVSGRSWDSSIRAS